MSYFGGQAYPADHAHADWSIYSRPRSVYPVTDGTYLPFTSHFNSPTSASPVWTCAGTQPSTYSHHYQSYPTPHEQTRGRRRRKTSIDKAIDEACRIDYMEILRSHSEGRSYNLRPRRGMGDSLTSEYNGFTSRELGKNHQSRSTDCLSQYGSSFFTILNQDSEVRPGLQSYAKPAVQALHEVQTLPKKRKYTRRSTKNIQVIDLTGSGNGSEPDNIGQKQEIERRGQTEGSSGDKKYSQKEMDIGEALVSLNTIPAVSNTNTTGEPFQDLSKDASFPYTSTFSKLRQAAPKPAEYSNVVSANGAYAEGSNDLSLGHHASSHIFSVADSHRLNNADCMLYTTSQSYSSYLPFSSSVNVPPPAYKNSAGSRAFGFQNEFYSLQATSSHNSPTKASGKESSRRRSARLQRTTNGFEPLPPPTVNAPPSWDAERSSPKNPKEKTEKPRTRMTYSKEQVEFLEGSYQNNPYLKPAERNRLAGIIGVEEKKIKIWFQNRRMRGKKETKNPSPIKSGRGRKPLSSITKDLDHQESTAAYPVSMQPHSQSPNQAFEYPMAKTPILPAAQFANSVSSAPYGVVQSTSYGFRSSSMVLPSGCSGFQASSASDMNPASSIDNPCGAFVTNYNSSSEPYHPQFTNCMAEGRTSESVVNSAMYQPMPVGNPASIASGFTPSATPAYSDVIDSSRANGYIAKDSTDVNYLSLPNTPAFTPANSCTSPADDFLAKDQSDGNYLSLPGTPAYTQETSCVRSEASLSPPQLVINEDYCDNGGVDFTTTPQQDKSLEELVLSKKIDDEPCGDDQGSNDSEIPVLSPCVTPKGAAESRTDSFQTAALPQPANTSCSSSQTYNPDLQSLERMLKDITPKASTENSSDANYSRRDKPSSIVDTHSQKKKPDGVSSSLFEGMNWDSNLLEPSKKPDGPNQSDFERARSLPLGRRRSSSKEASEPGREGDPKDADVRIIGETPGFKIDVSRFPSACSSSGFGKNGDNDSDGEFKSQYSPIIKPRAVRARHHAWQKGAPASESSGQSAIKMFDGVVIKDEPMDEFSTNVNSDSFFYNFANSGSSASQADAFANFNAPSPFHVPCNSPSPMASSSGSYSGVYVAQPITNPSLSRGYHHFYSTVNTDFFTKESSDGSTSTFLQL